MKSIYELAFWLWSAFMDASTELFTLDPMGSGGKLNGALSAVHKAYDAISDIAIPLATVCCILALLKIVISTAPQHQARAFLGSGLKFGIIVGFAANMWTIMSFISAICTGVIDNIHSSAGAAYGTLSFNSKMQDILQMIEDNINNLNIVDVFNGTLFHTIMIWLLGSILALVYLVIVVACAISITMTAFQRLFKPLIILPFSTIAIATGAGGPEVGKTLSQYIRTYIGFVLSGAVMVLAISLAASFGSMIDLGAFATDDDMAKLVLGSIEMALIPVVTTGLIKGADQIISKALAL